MFKKIERKDLLYWLGFSIVLWLLSSDYGKENQVLLDNWTFAGTVVSIILAVIAIIITVDQGSTAVDSTKNLEKASEKIEVVSSKLEEISVDKLFENLEKKIESINSTLDERMEIKFSGIEELINRSYGKSDKSVDGIFTKEEWKKKISFTETSGISNMVSLYVYLSYKYKKEIKVNKLAEILVENMKGDKQYLHTLLVSAFSSACMTYDYLGIIGIEIKSNTIYVTNISLEFSEAIEERKEEAEKENHYMVKEAVDFFK